MIKLLDVNIRNSNNSWFSSDSEVDDDKRSELDIQNASTLNKIIEIIKDFCDICIKSKYTKIIKNKAITPQIQKLKEIHANLWGSNNLPSIFEKNYIGLLVDKYI